MQKRSALLFVTLLVCAACAGEELDGSLHFTGGTNKNPNSASALSAGLRLDPALFSPLKSQVFDAGVAFDRVQGHSGISVDFRAKVAFLRCYGSEYSCEGRKKFWLTAIPSVGKRWGDGGLGGYAGTQLQAVFDLRRELACCKFALGLQHRFPFNSSLRSDNALVLELRVPLMFRDHAPPPPPPPPANPTR
jgi:hypothetical protein